MTSEDDQTATPSSDDRPQEWTLWTSIRRLAPGFIKRSYSAKFLVSFLFVVVLITAIGTASFVQIRGTIQEDAGEQVRSTAQMRADVVGQWVMGMQGQTRVVSGADALATGNRTRYLHDARAAAGLDVVDVHFVETDGDRVVASTADAYRNRSLADLDVPWVQTLDRPSTPSSVAVTRRAYQSDDQTVVAFVSPTQVPDTALVVVGSLEHHLGDDPALSTTIVNAAGESLTDSTSATTVNASLLSASKRTGTVQLADTGGALRAYAPIEGTDWVAVTTAAKADVYQVADAVGSNVARIVIMSVVSLSVIGYVLGRQTVVPLVRLRRRTEQMQQGDLDVDLSTDRRDEIGRLYRGFARMRDALRQQIRDAHEARREAEESRREMERQNERLDQFASTLSHDLRNPLAVARGHVELLGSELAGDDPAPGTLQTHVEKVNDAHERIDAIIEDVLMLTREGEHVEETTQVDIEDVATEAWTNVDDRNATLTVTDSHVIEADRVRLLRVFENLYRNAIDHVGEDVTVTVGLLEDGFYVADDGPGIPEDELDSLFEYGHTTSEEGTGLGLSIVKTIVEAHGWSISVDTDYDDGACFAVTDVFEDEPLDFEETAFEWGGTESEFEWGTAGSEFEWGQSDD